MIKSNLTKTNAGISGMDPFFKCIQKKYDFKNAFHVHLFINLAEGRRCLLRFNREYQNIQMPISWSIQDMIELITRLIRLRWNKNKGRKLLLDI